MNTYDNEINLLEDNKLNNLIDITQLIGEVKYKIEKVLFIDYKNEIVDGNSYLLIINDEYIPKSFNDIELDDKSMTRKELNNIILNNKLGNEEKISNVLKIDIDIMNLKEIICDCLSITVIDPNLFSGLVNLEKMKID
jgi:hypothetical protein